ncbi:hypothetical protein GCM10009547_08840 [Sporichthya brevicatena]|uniref:Uncharacterized protein n=1 Tax=Sporichthya brevicatena TaxID=171442 RepID=A0ABN1GDA1_9ACTN
MYYDYQWDAPTWLNRRLGWIVVALFTAALLVAGSSWAWSHTRAEAFGPRNPEVSYVGVGMDKRQQFHVAFEYVEAPGKTVTLLEVEPLTSNNVEFVGAVAAFPREGSANIGVGPAFPPRAKATYPVGATIPATATTYVPRGWNQEAPVALVAGFRLTNSEIGALNGIRAVYTVDGKRHTVVARHAVIACPGSCRAYRDRDTNWPNLVLRRLGLLPHD